MTVKKDECSTCGLVLASLLRVALRPAHAMVSNLWLVYAALAFGLFAFFCGFAIGFRSSPTLLQRGFNQMEKGDGAKPSDAPQNGSSSGGIPSTGILESRILALLDERIFTQRSLRTVQTLK